MHAVRRRENYRYELVDENGVADPLADLVPELGHLGSRGGVQQQALAGLGQANPARGPLQQTGAEPAFQAAHRLRQRRRRYRQFGRGAAEAGMPGDAGECGQRRQQGGVNCEVCLHFEFGLSGFIRTPATA